MRLWLLACVVVLCAAVSPVRGELLFDLEKTELYGAPGSTVTVRGTLKNTGWSPLYLNDHKAESKLPVDDRLFLTHTKTPFAPGESRSGDLFEVRLGKHLDPGGRPMTAMGIFTIFGGASASSHDKLASRSYLVHIAVPASTTSSSY